jgi:hypothetical protein
MLGAQHGTALNFRDTSQRNRMKPLALVGVVLMVLGLAALVYQGVTYTSRETVIDIGPVRATADRERTLPLPPVLGIGAVAAGAVLLIVSARQQR